jgi:uncharacterized protein YecT (DUF1311 family)
MFIRALVVLLVVPISMAMAQSQRAMNDRAAQRAHRADSTLNALYGQLEAKYRSDSVALRKLEAAQRAWIVFRDAQIEATYPAVNQPKAYGSVLPMCISALLEELNKARIAQLRRALRPEEGDVCAGGAG